MQSFNKAFIRYTYFVLIFTFLVILAGGIVRTTQSGMGCPDWPTCFGKWIPPLSEKDLPPDFEKYLSKQDIDHTFNVYHTWIEAINRYVGALLGVFIFIHLIWSYRKFFKTNRKIFWWSLGMLLLTGFQGWLGKTVVDSNLAVVKITVHMLVAILIAAIPVVIIHLLNNKEKIKDGFLKLFVTFSLVAIVIQIILGTDVREQIDEISKQLNYESRHTWIGGLNNFFLVHRLFAYVVVLICSAVAFRALRYSALRYLSFGILFLVLSSFALGIILAEMNMPAFAQPLHMLIACSLAIVMFRLRLKL